MSLVGSVPRLLRLVHEIEDEGVLLKRVCEWMRDAGTATSSAVIARDGLDVLCVCGIEPRDVTLADVTEVCRTGVRRTTRVEGELVSIAPVHDGGVVIGATLVRGPSTEADALNETASLGASVVAGALRARLDALATNRRARHLAADILGEAPATVALRDAIARAAVTSFPVLIEGESGTGKELVARALHRLSGRRDRRFCAVNCAALTEDLIEAELFGHVRGAFTGAVGPRPGLFEEAQGGTLLLDEVAELSARGQAKLLRVLQEREVRRVGENTPRAVDVRIIGATNANLAAAVAEARFREDLRFRLAVIRIAVPPLRARIEDLPLLARTFWRRLSADAETRATLGPDAVASLCRHDWPGNVRELQNVIAAMAVAAPSRGVLTARHVSAVLGAGAMTGASALRLDAAVRGYERHVVAAALARHGGRRTRAAVELGLTRQGLTKAIRRLGLGVTALDATGVAS